MMTIKKTSQLGRNVFSGSFSALLQIAIMLISYPVYLHFLGPNGYGVWLLLSTVLTFAQLGNVGISQALTKLTAEKYVEDEFAEIEEYTSSAISILFFTGGLLVAIVTLFRYQIIRVLELPPEYIEKSLKILPLIALLAAYVLITQALLGVLSGLGRIDLSNYLTLISRCIIVIFATIGLIFEFGIEALLVANFVATASLHIFCVYLIKKIHPFTIFRFRSISRARIIRMLCFGGPIVLGSVLNMLLAPFNKLATSHYLGVQSVPILEIAFQAAMQIRALFALGLTALMPEVSRLSAVPSRENWVRLKALHKRSISILLVYGGTLHIVVFWVAPIFLRIWLGSRFTPPLDTIFQIILVGSFFSLLATPAYYALMGAGWVGSCFGAYAVQSTINVVIIVSSIAINDTVSLERIAFSVTLGLILSSIYQTWRHRCLVAENSLNSQ